MPPIIRPGSPLHWHTTAPVTLHVDDQGPGRVTLPAGIELEFEGEEDALYELMGHMMSTHYWFSVISGEHRGQRLAYRNAFYESKPYWPSVQALFPPAGLEPVEGTWTPEG